MKKELNCYFVEDEDESEEEDEDNSEFEDKVENALAGNDNIKNSDEFKFFNLIMRNIKMKEPTLFHQFLDCLNSEQ